MSSARVTENLLPDGTMAPISGIRKMPVVSIEQCISSSGIPGVSCLADLPELEGEIEDVVFAAQLKAEEFLENNGPDKHGLTQDHIAAFYLYTHNVLYDSLNKVLRSEDRREVKPYFSYLRLLMDAFRLLPAYQPHNHTATVYRGINKDISAAYREGLILFFWVFSSYNFKNLNMNIFSC